MLWLCFGSGDPLQADKIRVKVMKTIRKSLKEISSHFLKTIRSDAGQV